ncbi:MAG: HAD family phosphatase [Puniceicoccales bacterium]|jgi:HAD superfamily hydrolase (TIGR01509 family)|nr:HAD family phosphatase [Puniceicoccales bacterium]
MQDEHSNNANAAPPPVPPPATPFAAIFDWDGVIVDSSQAHERSWEILAAEEKRTLPPGHFKRGFGRKNEFIIPNILQWADPADTAEIRRLGARKEALYREIVAGSGLEPLPGVRELLAGLRDAKIPCAVGSSSHRENIDLALRLLGLTDFFAGIVTSENVGKGKPDPEVFLKAAASVGCAAGNGVVFEDALAGVEAGLAGGFRVIGVATTNPAADLAAAGATLVVERLTAVTAETVRRLATGSGYGDATGSGGTR